MKFLLRKSIWSVFIGLFLALPASCGRTANGNAQESATRTACCEDDILNETQLREYAEKAEKGDGKAAMNVALHYNSKIEMDFGVDETARKKDQASWLHWMNKSDQLGYFPASVEILMLYLGTGRCYLASKKIEEIETRYDSVVAPRNHYKKSLETCKENPRGKVGSWSIRSANDPEF